MSTVVNTRTYSTPMDYSLSRHTNSAGAPLPPHPPVEHRPHGHLRRRPRLPPPFTASLRWLHRYTPLPRPPPRWSSSLPLRSASNLPHGGAVQRRGPVRRAARKRMSRCSTRVSSASADPRCSPFVHPPIRHPRQRYTTPRTRRRELSLSLHAIRMKTR